MSKNTDKTPTAAATRAADPLVGQTISLNLKVQTYWGVGPIWLSPEYYHATIPDLTKADLDTIRTALSAGILVKGKKYIVPVDQNPKVLEEYSTLLRASSGPSESPKLTTRLRQAIQTRGEGGYTAQEIIRHMIKSEQQTRNKLEWVAWLNKALMLCDGNEVSIPEPNHDVQGIKQEI